MKGRKGKRTAHVVPLGPRALAVLQQRRDVASQLDLFVFGTRAGTSKAPGATRRAPIALPDFQGKDLRRTAATLMATHGITEFVIARVLAHKNASITGIYNRYEYVAEKRIALDTLDRVLGAILTPADAATATLLPFQRAK
jgi:integrase